MPDTRLILHVKGTEAETTELPKHVVRTAISQGQLSQSQLIWSPADSAWKQVRELPDLLPGERLILHVRGTEAETAELPKHVVRAAISEGQITHSQLIWSPAESAWKQVRELPELLPSQKLAPPPSRAPAASVPRVADAIIPESPAGPVPRAVVAVGSAGTPQMRVASAETPRVRAAAPAAETPSVRAAAPAAVRSTASFKVKQEAESSLMKWICIGLGTLILLVFAGNYLLVDRPLVSNLGKTSYSNVTVYAHLGAFIQPNVMVIHIPASSKITPDNLTDFLATLARSTPENPITRDLYTRVALTSGWKAQYSISGYSWKELGDMQHEDKAEQKEALLGRLADASGEPLMPESTLSDSEQQAKRERVWAAFVTHFAAKR